MMSLKSVLTAALLTLSPLPGLAAQWEVNTAASKVNFEYERNGKAALGVFDAFSGGGVFDIDKPEDASLTVRIDTKSIDLDDALASHFAQSQEWFDSKSHRYVTFTLTGLTERPDGRYDAQGRLSVRGKIKAITAVIALDLEGPIARARGELRLNRKDYNLGVGPVSAFVSIGKEVAVRFDLNARRVR